MKPGHRAPASVLLISALLLSALAGCMDRRIAITSDPAGALVYLNDVEVGRTPLQTRFLWYGTYDVRVRLEGYEPITTARTAHTPIYEIPPLDLPLSALPIRTTIRWHFDLTPIPIMTPEAEAELVGRALELREQLH
jgi:hypothetical protein